MNIAATRNNFEACMNFNFFKFHEITCIVSDTAVFLFDIQSFLSTSFWGRLALRGEYFMAIEVIFSILTQLTSVVLGTAVAWRD